jgi:hypothetical protein
MSWLELSRVRSLFVDDLYGPPSSQRVDLDLILPDMQAPLMVYTEHKFSC